MSLFKYSRFMFGAVLPFRGQCHNRLAVPEGGPLPHMPALGGRDFFIENCSISM